MDTLLKLQKNKLFLNLELTRFVISCAICCASRFAFRFQAVVAVQRKIFLIAIVLFRRLTLIAKRVSLK